MFNVTVKGNMLFTATELRGMSRALQNDFFDYYVREQSMYPDVLESNISGISWSRHDDLIAISSTSGITIRAINGEINKLTLTAQAFKVIPKELTEFGNLKSASFSNNGELLAACLGCHILIFSAMDWQLVSCIILKDRFGEIQGGSTSAQFILEPKKIIWLPSDNALVLITESGWVICNLNTGNQFFNFYEPSTQFEGEVSSDGSLIAICTLTNGVDKQLSLTKIDDLQLVSSFELSYLSDFNIAWGLNSSLIAFTEQDKVLVMDMSTGGQKTLATVENLFAPQIRWSKDNSILAVGTINDGISLFSASSGAMLCSYRADYPDNFKQVQNETMAWSSKNQIAIGRQGESTIVWTPSIFR